MRDIPQSKNIFWEDEHFSIRDLFLDLHCKFYNLLRKRNCLKFLNENVEKVLEASPLEFQEISPNKSNLFLKRFIIWQFFRVQ